MSPNLIPVRRQLAKRKALRLRRWALALGLYAATGLVVVAVGPTQPRGDDGNRDRLEAAQSQVARYQTQAESLKVQHDELHVASEGVRIVLKRPEWSVLLDRIASARGDEIVLTSLKIDGGAQRGAETEAAIHRAEVVLVGYAATQAQVSGFAVRLEASGMFSDVSITESQASVHLQRRRVRFQIECMMEPGPVRQEGAAKG